MRAGRTQPPETKDRQSSVLNQDSRWLCYPPSAWITGTASSGNFHLLLPSALILDRPFPRSGWHSQKLTRDRAISPLWRRKREWWHRCQRDSELGKIICQSRARYHRGQLPSVLGSTVSKTSYRAAVQLPQELIDAIIDEFDPSLTEKNRPRVFPDRETLRSCALVARAFVRPSQAKIFSTVNLSCLDCFEAPEERSRLFSKLLSSKPHIRSYVRTLILSYRCTGSNFVGRILCSLPNLDSLSLRPSFDDLVLMDNLYPPFPTHLRDPILAVFSTTSIRRLELRNHQFDTAQELQHILENGRDLKELMLLNIRFTDVSPRPSGVHQGPSNVAIESLQIFQTQPDVIEAILNTFTAVDITHLRSLSCDRYYKPLLQANAYSIHELTLEVTTLDIVEPEALDLILPANGSLRTLNLKLDYIYVPVFFIDHCLGNLARLKALKQISITGRIPSISQAPAIDKLLGPFASGLEEIHVGMDILKEGDTEAAFRRCMPTLDAGVLKISTTALGSVPGYFVR
ncbi:hypothetical protein DFH09DRAFT_1416082 [Mycena vulgaris]|nr:hypothetical protein DFH09DRAFT_1416082 [Mycena vulgaris]